MLQGTGMVQTVRLQALRHNAALLRLAVPRTARLMAVVKADAYGHGLVQAAKAFADGGVDAFAVARVEEGLQLRSAGFRQMILVLGLSADEDLPAATQAELSLTAGDLPSLMAIRAAAIQAGKPARVHLALDTGMGRIGVRSKAETETLLKVCEHPSLRPEGVFTHFPDADGDDPAATQAAFARFMDWTDTIPAGMIRHCANSAAMLRFPDMALDMVRAGIVLYGYPPIPTEAAFTPAMTWDADVRMVKALPAGCTIGYGCSAVTKKTTVVATIACGYGDGYPRADGLQVLLHGQRVPVLGRVCMDQMMVDVTGLPQVQPGDRAVLMGTDGDERITADHLAKACGTICYDLLMRATSRVVRRWVE